MRSKKIFSFDEKKDAEEIITNGFEKGIDYSKMYVVAKYFRSISGFGAIRLERELIKFCKTQDANFNPIVEAEQIKKWVNAAMKFSLRKIDNIIITQKEINFLKEIENGKDRKILFMTLVIAKALKYRSTKKDKIDLKVSDNYYIHYNNFLDIIRLTKLNNFTEIDYCLLLNKYLKYFTVYSAEKELIRIEYVDKETEGIIIDDLDNTLDFYNSIFNNKEKNIKKDIKHCVVCGTLIVKKSNNQKSCPECSIKLERERKKRWKDKK